MEAAVVAAGVQNAAAFDQHDLAWLVGNNRNGQRGKLRAGKFFSKHLGRLDVGENASVAVIIDLQHLQRAAEQDADIARRRAFGEYGVFFIKADYLGIATGQHFEKMFIVNALEEQTVFQNR